MTMIETDEVPPTVLRGWVDETAGWPVEVWHLSFALPRQTGDLLADLRALDRARLAATTDAQRAACDLRAEQLAERLRAALDPLADAIGGVMRQVGETFAAAARTAGQALAEIAEQLGLAAGTIPPPEPADERLGADPMSAAILAKRQRNTGPDRGRLDRRHLGLVR